MRPLARLALGVLVLHVLGCDQGSKSQPSSTDKPDESKAKKKSAKDDGDDDDDNDTPKKKTKTAKKDDDDDDKPSSGSKSKLPSKSDLSSSIGSFFGGYVDGASFDFYGDTFASSVDKFLSMKSTSPAEMAKQARAFYTGKTGLKYTPISSTLVVTPDDSGASETARLDVKMEWQYPPQKSWQTVEGQKVFHAHVATVEIVVGADGKWTSYGEPGLKRDSYRVVAQDGVLGGWTTPGDVTGDDFKAPLRLKKGDVVQDGFETLVVDTNTKGDVVARKIHQDGKDWWALQTSAVAVENPNGGTSAGEDTFLEKVK